MGCTAPWENLGAIGWPPSSAMRALPAITRFLRLTQTTASIRCSCHCSLRRLSTQSENIQPECPLDAVLTGTLPRQPSLRRVVIAATIRNVLEWFDFLVYG